MSSKKIANSELNLADEVISNLSAIHNTTNETNGGFTPLVDGENNELLKGASSPPPDIRSSREEASILRQLAFNIAMKAAFAAVNKDSWSYKDFDLAIATWVKIAGVETKMEGDADGILKLIDDLTDGDDNPDGG